MTEVKNLELGINKVNIMLTLVIEGCIGTIDCKHGYVHNSLTMDIEPCYQGLQVLCFSCLTAVNTLAFLNEISQWLQRVREYLR